MSDRSDSDGIPSIRPARDEVASYRRSQERGVRSDTPHQSNFNGMLVFVIVVMAIMMGVGGFTIYEVQQKLDQSNVLLAKGQESIRELERRLAATGTDVSKTLVIMQDQMETNEDEIRKLWDVSNKRNRGWIEANEAGIAAASKELRATRQELVAVQRVAEQVHAGFGNLSATVLRTREELLAENEELSTQVSMVRRQIQDQSVELSGAQRSINILIRQLKVTEEAIVSIDRERKIVNRKLADLQQELRLSQLTDPPRQSAAAN